MIRHLAGIPLGVAENIPDYPEVFGFLDLLIGTLGKLAELTCPLSS